MAIPNQTVTMHHVGTVVEDIPMGFKAEDFVHLAGVLDGLYSDPTAAVIREYSTNAWDSHVMAGVSRPIEVTLPTTDNLEFIVQDFGVGMSVDDLRETYSMYGRSDKRGSNAIAGQLGLGSKSGLSYAEAFTVTAVKNGVKTIAMVTKDEHGIGVIKVLDTLGTSESNGVRIAIPVGRWDVDSFHTRAKALFQFWEPGTVLIDGEPITAPDWMTSALRLDEDTIVVAPNMGLGRSYVIMGNVPYPVPDVDCGNYHRRFVARLNIGDVDFVPSREDVKYTPHTKATLAELHEYINHTFKRALAKAKGTTTSAWEETLLKMLWMDRTMSLKGSMDSPIWTYEPGAYGRKSKSHITYRVNNVVSTSTTIITKFPAKNVSTVARERMQEHFPTTKNFVIVPASVSVGHLDGRPNVATWDEVLAATTTVVAKGKPRVKRPKTETRYSTNGPQMTADELASVNGKVLYLNPGESMRYGDLDATVVYLYSVAQLPRVQRFVPGIKHYSEEAERQRKIAADAITSHDREILKARSLPQRFSDLNPLKIEDPELAEAIRLNKALDTPTILKAKALGCLPANIVPGIDFTKRYPLLANLYGMPPKDDAILYINAKFAAEQSKLALDTKAS